MNRHCTKLKDAHKAQDLAAVDKATAELTAVWQAASEELYKNQQPGGQQGPQQGYTADAGAGASVQDKATVSKKDDEVTDVDFEEVK